MSGFVFAQDTGTGLTNRDSADWTDAANLMALCHADNTTQYKVSGLSVVSTDFANDQVTIGTGQARIKAENVSTVDHSSDGTKEIGSYTWDEVTIAVVLANTETVNISSTGITNLFIDSALDSGNPDEVQVTTSEPTSPSIQIASVDADSESVDESYNVYPDVSYEILTATSVPEPPTPNSGEVVKWFDESTNEYKMKFDDGSSVTIAQR